MLTALWLQLSAAPSLAVDSQLTWNIVRQSGAEILCAPSRVMVSVHAFLEMLHYGVWIVAIPLVTMSFRGWNQITPAQRSRTWRTTTSTVLALALLAVGILWVCFVADYATTRELYFRLAMIHVLAEVPFLLRLL
jgi:hypothetical protein